MSVEYDKRILYLVKQGALCQAAYDFDDTGGVLLTLAMLSCLDTEEMSTAILQDDIWLNRDIDAISMRLMKCMTDAQYLRFFRELNDIRPTWVSLLHKEDMDELMKIIHSIASIVRYNYLPKMRDLLDYWKAFLALKQRTNTLEQPVPGNGDKSSEQAVTAQQLQSSSSLLANARLQNLSIHDLDLLDIPGTAMEEIVEQEEVPSCQTSVCSTLGSEMTANLQDLELSEANDGDWRDLPQLIELRTKFRSEMIKTETRALTLEQEICENRVSEEKSLCRSCGLVKEPRQRKIAELRLMHQAMLKSKPKCLLCTAGIISSLEQMILEGQLDFHHGFVNNTPRCRRCRQEINDETTRSYLMSEFIDILEDQRSNCTNTENCSMTEACCACLDFMLSQLKNPDLFKDQDVDEPKDVPVLFQNIVTEKLDSLSAEFDKIKVNLNAQSETQKDLVEEVEHLRENQEKFVTTEKFNEEIEIYNDKLFYMKEDITVLQENVKVIKDELF